MNIKIEDIDYVLITHLDCDHANGLSLIKGAKNILVSEDEVNFAKKNGMVRYQKKWWKGVRLTKFRWNKTEGPFQRSYNLFDDDSIQLINIPGHCDGMFAVKVLKDDGKYVLLYSDGGYAEKSWKEMITSGIAADKKKQMISLQWIREQSINGNCIESLANHDSNVIPHVIEL